MTGPARSIQCRIRGEIARLAANRVVRDMPHSSMARWAHAADYAVMIDGCFLKCHRRVLSGMLENGRTVSVDALSLHKKHSDIFLMDDVPRYVMRGAAVLKTCT